MTPSGIEPVTFRFVAQHLNHSATAVLLGEKQYFYHFIMTLSDELNAP
jgi:hypothetical protein